MTDKSTVVRRLAFRSTLGTVLIGAGILASCTPAVAAPRAMGDPVIAQVEGQRPFTSVDGIDHFLADDWNVGIWVRNSGPSAVHGDLTVRDDESGEVLCKLPQRALEALADCPAFLGPGEHRVVGEVSANGVTKKSEPVVIESYAPEIPADGVAPHGVTVAGTAPGNHEGTTAVTLRGTPGDRVILRDQIWDDVLDTTFGESGTATAEVFVAAGRTDELSVETQRDGRRWTGTVQVSGNPQPPTDGGEDGGEQSGGPVVALPGDGVQDPGFTLPVVAQPGPGDVDAGFTTPGGQTVDPVTLVAVEPTSTADVARVTIQGHAGDVVDLGTTEGRHFWWHGVLDQDGRASFDVWGFPNGEQRTFTGTVSRDGVQHPVSLDVTSNAREPITAEPLEFVGAQQTTEGTLVTFRGTPGARYDLSTQGQHTSGTIAPDGLVRWAVSIPQGQVARVSWTTFGEAGAHHGVQEVAGPGVDDAAPAQIRVVGVEATATADVARVTIAGNAGDAVELHDGAFWWSGRLDDAGRASFDVWDFPNGEERTLRGEVRRGSQRIDTAITVTSEARKPVHAEALEHLDTTFTERGADVTFRGTPGASFRFAGPGEGPWSGVVPEDGLVRFSMVLDDRGAGVLSWQTIGDDHVAHTGTLEVQRPVTAEPGRGTVDPGFTVPGDQTGEPGDGDGGQPGDGGQTGDPGDPGDQTGDPGNGDDDGTPVADVAAEVLRPNGVTGTGILRVQDRLIAEYSSYYADVLIDGKQTESVLVSGKLREQSVRTGGPGAHTLELRKDGRSLTTVQYTVPETVSPVEPSQPTEQFAAALVGVNRVTKAVSYTVQDAGLTAPGARYTVQAWVDGRPVGVATVDATAHTETFPGGKAGTHRVELRTTDGRVLGGFEYTVPGAAA